MKRFDVVVVGARCAGSPLATMLARRGLSVCLVDRAQFPSETPSTHIIQPCGVQVLDRLGVLDAIVGTGAVKLDRLTMVIDDAVRIESTLDPAVFPHPTLCVRRVTLDALLVEAAGAAGADVRTGVRVTGLTTEDGRFTGVETAAGEPVQARLMVGADGRHSTVASLVGAREYRVTSPGRMLAWGHCHVGECRRPGRIGGVSTATASYKGHRYPVEIINHCVWLYFRFPLSFREVEELMLVRGVVVSYETIRRWCAKFGQAYANQLRRRRPRLGDKWHLDEVFVKINGITGYLWRGSRPARQRLGRVGAVAAKRQSSQAVLP